MNPYFTYPNGFIPGTLIRAEEVNDLFMQLEVAFDNVDQDTPLFTGDFAPMTLYGRNKSYRDPVTGSLYIAVVTHTSTSIASDLADNKVRLAFDLEEFNTAVADSIAARDVARNFAEQTGAEVTDYPGEFSAKEHATGDFVPAGSAKTWAQGNRPEGSAKQWAVQLGQPVAGMDYSAKFWAQTAQAASNFQGVYDPMRPYSISQTVVDLSGRIYVSVVDGNQGNELNDPNFWIPLPLGNTGNAKLLFFGSF